MEKITGGTNRNQLARIYDRLRKRSMRNILVDRTTDEHQAYVKGVKDTLNAVVEETAARREVLI